MLSAWWTKNFMSWRRDLLNQEVNTLIIIETNLVDIKIEYTFYVERSHLKLKYLSENYNQEEDLV